MNPAPSFQEGVGLDDSGENFISKNMPRLQRKGAG